MGVDIHKNKVVSVRYVIFDKNIVWNEKLIVHSNDDIKELDETIIDIEISILETKEMEDIQLIKDAKIDKLTPTVTRQANHEDENFDENLQKSK